MLCVKTSTNLDALYGELGRTPLYVHRKLIMIKYLIKLIKSEENTILFKTYNMLKMMQTRKTHTVKIIRRTQIRVRYFRPIVYLGKQIEHPKYL